MLTVGGVGIRGATVLFAGDVVSGLQNLGDFALQVPTMALAIAIGVIVTDRWAQPPDMQSLRNSGTRAEGMSTILEQLRDAQNAHDAERMAALFANDYASSQPAHPGRTFVGRTQVLQNWSAVFDGIPDFVSELVSLSIDGNTEWGELYWHGHHVDGSSFAMRGVAIFVIRDGLVAEGRLYMEPVDVTAEDIEAAVQQLYKPPPTEAP